MFLSMYFVKSLQLALKTFVRLYTAVAFFSSSALAFI